MVRACARRLGRWILAALTVPLITWVILIALLPTGWLRERIVARLQEKTGQVVQLQEVRLGLLGEVKLRGLELSRPGGAEPAWLRTGDIRIDVDHHILLGGRIEPNSVQIKGLDLRLERGEGVPYVFADLLNRSENSGADTRFDPSRGQARPDPVVDFSVTNARLRLHDQPTGMRLELTQISAEGSWRPEHARLQRLIGKVNGGTFEVEADLERDIFAPTFELQVAVRDAQVGQGMELLAYLVPLFAGASSELQGQLNMNLYLRGQGDTSPEIAQSLVGKGTLVLDPISLRETPLVSELRKTLKITGNSPIGAVHTDFAVASGRVLSNDLTIEFGSTPLVLSGSTDFDGRLDYRIKSETITQALGGDARELLGELPLRLDDFVDVRLQGTPRRLVVSVDGHPINRPGPDRPQSEEEEWKELARKLRSRIFR